MNNTLMILLEFMVVMAAIFIGAKKGGLGLGIFGGLGLAVLVFVFKLKPQNPPDDCCSNHGSKYTSGIGRH